MATTHPAHGPSLAGTPAGERLDGLLLRRLAARVGPAALRYTLKHATFADTEPVATLRFHDRRAIAGLLLRSRGPLRGCVCRGPHRDRGRPGGGARSGVPGRRERRAPEPARLARDLAAALAAARAQQRAPPLRHRQRLLRALARRAAASTPAPTSSRPELSLEDAQVAKMDHVCRKLGLRPGETVVEAGCGWGALALHMARHYGVRVRACNVSREQIAFARARARREGLDDRVEFVEGDYREIRGTLRRLRLGRDARARGPAQLRRARPRDRRAASIPRAAAGCCTSSAATGRAR